MLESCITPEESKGWIDALASEKYKKCPIKTSWKTIWELQRERSDEAVEYSGLAVALQKGTKHLNIPKAEVSEICHCAFSHGSRDDFCP